MTIAVLDNGICADEIKAPVNSFCVGTQVGSDFVQTDNSSHGTVCAKIIEKYAPVDEFLDVTFIGEEGKADITDMTEALEFCLDKNVDVINLSCGIEDYTVGSDEYKHLADVCRALHEKGVKIYAAQNNIGRITIPAEFPFAVSVEQKDRIQNILTSIYRRSDIYTSGRHLIRLGGEDHYTEECNSFACAYATAKNLDGESGDYKDLFDGANDKLAQLIERESKRYPKAEIPVIYIEKSPSASGLADWIKKSFLAEGYSADILSSNRDDGAVGAFYVPEECIHAYINLFAYFNDNDVVLVITEELPENSEDVIISFIEEMPVLSIESNGGQGKYDDPTDESNDLISDLDTLFNRIKKYYT